MIVCRTGIALPLLALAGIATAATPSFDCAKAVSEAEKLVCADAGLAQLDRSLAELYATVLKNTPDAQQSSLRTEQRGWVKGRDDCWKDSDQKSCIARSYRERIAELKDR